MNKDQVLSFLREQETPTLLELLEQSFEHMTPEQRREVFGPWLRQLPKPEVKADSLLKEIKQFQHRTITGVYYAPFQITARNRNFIPNRTREWFERLGDLLEDASHLALNGEAQPAREAFETLFELIFAMEEGEQVVFAFEVGPWMIPGEAPRYVGAYLQALAAVETPAGFVEPVLTHLRRDSRLNFEIGVYGLAMKVANDAQKAALEAEVKRSRIRVGRGM